MNTIFTQLYYLYIFELILCLLSNKFENKCEQFPIKKNEQKIIVTSYNCWLKLL